jgi:site-specific DNA recombinase
VAALRERIAREGLHLSDELQFIDEGDRGATLVRPALERLRDAVAVGAVDRL